jgi:hypothetical protein
MPNEQHIWILLVRRVDDHGVCIFEFDWIFISSDRQDVTFVLMKSHCIFEIAIFVEILLQMLCIDRGFYSHLCNGVVCK